MNHVLKLETINKKDLLGTLILLGAMVAIAASAQMGIEFDIHKIVPGISYAAAAVGLHRAYKAYKAGKGVRKAIALVFGWSVVGFLVSWLGDWAVGYLLRNHIDVLASY
ncbi:hypothetical protein [Bacillus sp. Marseille-Q1617]|uniref:hypothetical protein n=1 Tax=Bacillus sp. Marseille-Q1617 TaxID=2736887 RepID=UPI00158C0051|nr:hypothetical protein [Bacillus sp. Marseille-Q1617]